jgi:hypothetical protein
MKKVEYDYGDKRKLTEIKKKFKIDQFTKILDSKDNPSIFSTLEEITKVDISIDDEFTNKMGLVNFFKKISNQLTYAPLIAFAADNEFASNFLDFGLLKCTLNKKNDFQIYLIKSETYTKGISYGDVYSYDYFELNKEPENNQLLKILYNEIKKNSETLYTDDIYFFAKLNWSKARLKKLIKNTDKKLVFH